MREEKSEEPIPLEPVPSAARELKPDELLLEGNIEIRPCSPCRLRLYVPAALLGTIVPCPRCGAESRALAAAGPFVEADFDSQRMPRLEPPIELVPANITSDPFPALAPVVPYRRADPIDERSPMVDAVASLQWVGGAFLIAVSIFQLGTFWKLEHTTAADELIAYASAAGRCFVAALLFAASSGVHSRTRNGWGLAFALSAIVIVGGGYFLAERALGDGGYRARFDYGILLELPTFLIAVFSAVVLVVPRYRAEFRSNQSGTM